MAADVSRLAALGFRAEYPLLEGLKQFVDWLASQGPVPESFAKAEQHLQSAGVVRSVKR
jgi:hypothetical protein